MKPYLNLEPPYEIIYTNKDKHNLKIVKLKNNVKFALKHLRVKPTNKSQIDTEVDNLLREYRIGNILGKLTDGIVMSKDIEKKKLEEYTVIEILMEYGGIPLSAFVNREKLEEGDTMNIACQLLSILTLMKELGISHLGINPSNIVWDKNKNRVKLIDFGTSLISFGKGNRVFKGVDSKSILEGTRQYAAPEIGDEAKRVISQRLDVYSFGVTFLRLLAAEYKIQNLIEYDENFFIKKLNIEELKEKVEREDMDDLWEVIYRSIEKTPQFRPTFRELREVFLKQAKGMTKDDYLLDVVDNLNDHSVRIEWTNNMKLKNIYEGLMNLYFQMENYDVAIKSAKKYLEICSKLEGESSLGVSYSYYILASLYIVIDEKKEARNCFEKALTILSKMGRKNNRLLRMLERSIGLLNIYLGDYKKTKEQYSKALKKKSEEYEVDVDLYDNMAEAYICMGYHEKAEELCNTVLNKMQKERNIQGISIAKLYTTLGLIYFIKANYKQAKKSFNEALSILLNNYGEKSLLLIVVYYVLGILNDLIGKFDQAIEAFDKSLSISLPIHGEMNSYTTFLYNCKALAYQSKKDYKRSIEFYNKSLNISLRKFGSQHQLTLLLYLHLGKSYYEIDDSIIAKSYFSKAFDIAKVYEEENIEDLLIYDILGKLSFSYESKVDKAIDYWKRVLNILLKKYGEKHSCLLGIYSNLVLGYYSKLNFQEVIRLCKIGLEIVPRISAKKNEMFGFFYLYLGNSYFLTGDRGSSINYIQKASKIFSSIYGKKKCSFIEACLSFSDFYESVINRPQALNTTTGLVREDQGYQDNDMYKLSRYSHLARAYYNKKDYSNAKTAYEKAIESSLNIYGELHFVTIRLFYTLASIYVELDEIKEAESYLETVLSMSVKALGETHYLTGMIYDNLATIYKKTNRLTEYYFAIGKACIAAFNKDNEALFQS